MKEENLPGAKKKVQIIIDDYMNWKVPAVNLESHFTFPAEIVC